ncbi:histidine phosphatase family protein [Bacillus salitolerans]|uniref:Histidine phosphatase family protein n=1 Tax=Bacillus salitolerans TaxID=1437434 RepID=A0ABW4LU91_9BACI
MNTFIYMVRHGDSPKVGDERTRGLTESGKSEAIRVADLLKMEGINAVVSSPYIRSILTVEKLADELGQDVLVYEDLKERVFSSKTNRISDKELFSILEKSFSDPKFALKGAESNIACQERAINVLKELLVTYRGRRVVIGTHGVVMTLMINYYDKSYDLDFLLSTSKPDIYKLEFINQDLIKVERLWYRDLTCT